MTLESLSQTLAAHHLILLGHCVHDGGTLVLIGPDEPTFWDHFSQSPEYNDTAPNPLDRWSSRVLTAQAQAHGGTPFFPFGGPPYHPFYTWALKTQRFFASPIGFLVHEERGLFASFRGAIHLPITLPVDQGQNPCTACDAPCKSACPVGAFADGYDVTACKTHINAPAGANCIAQGCRARRACPIHQGNRPADQAAHHMKAFQ